MAELHFIRSRQKGSVEPFCDPMADVKELLDGFFTELPAIYKKVFNPDEDKFHMLKAIFKVFLTRLKEDRTSVLDQIKEFNEVINERYSKEEVKFFTTAFAHYMFISSVLFYRRDAKVDAKERKSLRMSSVAMTVASMFKSWDSLTKDNEHLKAAMADAPEEFTVVDAICVEDTKFSINDIKNIVADAIGSSVEVSWKEIAEACDSYVVAAKEDTEEVVAAAIAYPDYNAPYFEVTKEDEGGSGKA